MISNPPTIISGEFTTGNIGNIDDLDFQNKAIIRFTNGSLATLRGLKAGNPGQVVFIIAAGAQVNLAHQNAGSSAPNRLINTVTSDITPLTASKGSAIYEYDVTNSRWRLVTHVQGAWLTVPFNAADFTGNGVMTWTVTSGQVSSHEYYIFGSTIIYSISVNGATVGGTPNTELRVAMPLNYLPNSTQLVIVHTADNGVQNGASLGGSQSSVNYIRFFRDVTGTNWTAGAIIFTRGVFTFSLQ